MFKVNAVLTAHINPRGRVINPIIPAINAVNFVVSISMFLFLFQGF